MRTFLSIVVLVLLGGCNVAEKRFYAEMARYEETCDNHFSSYITSDVDGAKRALQQIIDLSLAEQKRATRYWRFNLTIAFSYARLAVIAEAEGRTEEAEQLFSKASDFQLVQDKAYRAHLRSLPNVNSANEHSDVYRRPSIEDWRRSIQALDEQLDIAWKKKPNQPQTTTGSSAPDRV